MSTDAQREIDRATAEMKNPSFHPGWFHTRGYYYGQIGERLKAVDDYTKYIERKPDDPEVFRNRAIAYEILGEYQKAVDDYTKAISLDPDNAEGRPRMRLNTEDSFTCV